MIVVNKPSTYSKSDYLLLEMVKQSFPQFEAEEGGIAYGSGFIKVHCDVMYYLCEIGLMEPRFYRVFCAKVKKDGLS